MEKELNWIELNLANNEKLGYSIPLFFASECMVYYRIYIKNQKEAHYG